MIGNNIKKDVAGANRYGLKSIWLDWSPRYFHEYEEAAWKPDYIVKTPEELKSLIEKLEEEAENAEKTRGELKEYCKDRLLRIVGSFKKILYEEDSTFIKNMKDHNLAGDDIRKYRFWEWTQGVGLFGIWKLYRENGNAEYLETLKAYYDQQIETGFPSLNVNTVTPYLAMSFVAEETGEEKYMQPCLDAVKWIMESFPRTKEGGFQHMTSDSVNDQELWDDTLYMTVLFLANMGRILNDDAMKAEVEKQFRVHEKYLCDRKTGLWYHGWTFNGNNNFAGAFWGRGNSWITMFIPELLEIYEPSGEFRGLLLETFRKQADTLAILQEKDGMWHTLIDDPSSYTEASATCGFAYGILKGVNSGILEGFYKKIAVNAVKAILNRITDEGIVEQVSYGTPMGRETKDFYKQIEIKPMPYGQAMAMLLLMEFLKSC
jgi:unsaturated rhamnogalacturonyl hydrolase